MGAGGLDHFCQCPLIVQQRTGAQQVIREWLVVVVGHEQGRAQSLQQCFFPDAGIGVVDERAGVHVAVGVDVQVAPSTGNTAAGIFPIIPEVHGKNGLRFPEFPHLLIHEFPLLGGNHQLRYGVLAHRHVGKQPAELGTPLDHLVEVFLAADDLGILTGVAAGKAKGQTLLPQDGHGLFDAAESPCATAEVGGGLKALHTDGGDKVFHPQHVAGKRFVDEGGVGKGGELTVGMGLAQLDNVFLANQGFASGKQEEIAAKLVGLIHDAVHFRVAQVQLVAVLCRPAAGAMEVAGRGGVHQNGPGDVAAVLFPVLFLLGITKQRGVQTKIAESCL